MTGISVIIPTLNRKDFLKNTLDCLISQTFENSYEILIVDQSEEFDIFIAGYINAYPFITYFHITNFRGLPEARNFGWQHAKHDCILFLDDDILCGNNLLKEHYRFITQNDIGVVAGGITEKFKRNAECETGHFEYSTATPYRGFHKNQIIEVDHAGGGNFSVSKKILQEVNGIDENLTEGASLYEETDFCLRVKAKGYKILFNYNAHIDHLAADTGGCRVTDINKYVYSLTRNRTIIIERYLNWQQKVTASLYLFKLALAYAWSYKSIKLLASYLEGISMGKIASKKPIKNTIYDVN